LTLLWFMKPCSVDAALKPYLAFWSLLIGPIIRDPGNNIHCMFVDLFACLFQCVQRAEIKHPYVQSSDHCELSAFFRVKEAAEYADWEAVPDHTCASEMSQV